MTTDLTVRTEIFQGIPVRIVEKENKRFMPLVDLAEATGLAIGNLRRTLKKYHELLDPYSVSIRLISTDGKQYDTVSLERDGVTGTLLRSNYLTIKDPVKRNKILAFQKWAIETLGQVMDGMAVCQSKSTAEILQEQLNIALPIGRATYTPVQVSVACAIAETEKITGENLGYYTKTIVGTIPWDQICNLTATDLGKNLGGISAQATNQLLYAMGMQEPIPGGWLATEKAMDYCGLAPGVKYLKRGSVRWELYPLWNRSILARIEHHKLLHDLPE
jgi:hypothetical protein